jgi:MFS family permease
MILLGLGAGMALNPLLLAAMSDVEPSEAGLASGVVNTSFMMGGALGLAILASLAASRSGTLLALGEDQVTALTGGYHVAFLVGGCLRSRSGIAKRLASSKEGGAGRGDSRRGGGRTRARRRGSVGSGRR